MSIYKPRNSPFWHYDFQIKHRRFCGSTGERERRAAAKVEADKRREAAATIAKQEQAKGAPMTWAIAAGRFYDEVGQFYGGRRDANARACWNALQWLTAELGADLALTAITGDRITRLVARRRGQGVKSATVNRTVTEPLRRVLMRADAAWGCTVPRIDWRAHLLKESPQTIREISAADEAKTIEIERDDYAPAFRFALLSGCRLAEVVGLEWAAVDFGERQIKILGKGERTRLLPLTPDMREILWAERGNHAEAVFTYVCVRPSAEREIGERYPITYEGLKTRWRRTKKRAGVDARFHDLRHTFATRLLRASGNMRAVSALLGHSSLDTTARYAAVQMDDLRAAMMTVETRRAPVAAPSTKERSG